MIALITLTLLGTMIAVTQYVPTAGETQGAFDSAQKFYSSGALRPGDRALPADRAQQE